MKRRKFSQLAHGAGRDVLVTGVVVFACVAALVSVGVADRSGAQSLPFCGGQNAPPQPVPYTCTTQTQTIAGSQVFAVLHADGQTVTVTYTLLAPRTTDAPIRITHHIGVSGAGGVRSVANGIIPAGQTTATLSVTTPCFAGQVDIKFVFVLDTQPQGRVGGPWIQNGTGCTVVTTTTATTIPTTPPTTPATTTPTTTGTTTPSTPPTTPATTPPMTTTTPPPPGPQLTALAPARVWVGLKNGADVGLRVDLLAQVLKNGVLLSSRKIDDVRTGGSGFKNARLDTVPFGLIDPADFLPQDRLQFRLSVRNACAGPSHNSGTIRLWFNDAAANSRIGATLNGRSRPLFLGNRSVLRTSVGAGPRTFIDVAAGARCSAFKPFGTWSIQAGGVTPPTTTTPAPTTPTTPTTTGTTVVTSPTTPPSTAS